MLLTIKVNPILQLKIMEHGCCSASRKTTNITDTNDVRLIFFPVILGSLTPTEDDDCCASHSDSGTSIVNGACFQIYSL
jgi:hypothetical protein